MNQMTAFIEKARADSELLAAARLKTVMTQMSATVSPRQDMNVSGFCNGAGVTITEKQNSQGRKMKLCMLLNVRWGVSPMRRNLESSECRRQFESAINFGKGKSKWTRTKNSTRNNWSKPQAAVRLSIGYAFSHLQEKRGAFFKSASTMAAWGESC